MLDDFLPGVEAVPEASKKSLAVRVHVGRHGGLLLHYAWR
jgi:hypothetical protein